ncbi:hypothetical protein N865_07210 [Intrasporangium oryzae NRRL B-24470]|uniref:Uncharacterized protein n=1 Tax=Intrasporangium oryzae NRRL B-24470 TaxID=1386089 RepID=W9GB82_9MICO|nr:hypothetical protein N865_07210 [Intrasporangium oryzae NRRL B-24470]
MRERELHLVADDRPAEGRVGAAPPVEGVVRDAHGADPAGVEELTQAGHRHRVGDHGVRLVHLVERDRPHAEPARARLRATPDDRRERGEREELARHDDPLAVVAERVGEDPLAPAEAVDLGRVEEGHPELAGPPHDVDRHAGGVAVAVSPLARSELPRPEPHPADRAQPVHLDESHP